MEPTLRQQLAAAMNLNLEALAPHEVTRLDLACLYQSTIDAAMASQQVGNDVDLARVVMAGNELDRLLNPASDGAKQVVFALLPGESGDAAELTPEAVQIAELKQQIHKLTQENAQLRTQLDARRDVEPPPPAGDNPPPTKAAVEAIEPAKPLLNQPVQAVSGEEAKRRMNALNSKRAPAHERDTRPYEEWRPYVAAGVVPWSSPRAWSFRET